MSRCKGCNRKLTDGEMIKINPKTSDYDDLCKHCRDPLLDTGIIYGQVVKDGGSISIEPVEFINEAGDVCDFAFGMEGGTIGQVEDDRHIKTQ